MRSRSARFDRVVRGSHQMTSTVDVLYGRAPLATDLAVTGGAVDYDRTAAILGRCSVSLAEPALIPTPTGPLTPYGYELRVRRGIHYSDDTVELLDLGVFPIQNTNIDGNFLATNLMGFDRSQLVIDASLEDDYTVAAGTNVATAIQALINAGVPGLTFLLPTTTFTTPDLVFPMGSDRWAHARAMAASVGWELYFDGLGRCVGRPEPSLVGVNPDWTIDEGATGVLVNIGLELDRRPAFNKVIATGENTSNGAVYRGEASDSNALSPTYYSGGFGRKPTFIRSPLYTSNTQCQVAAEAKLATVLGVARSLRLSAVTQPALEAGDAVRVVRTSLGVDELHLIDKLRVGLGAEGSMTLQTRAVQ